MRSIISSIWNVSAILCKQVIRPEQNRRSVLPCHPWIHKAKRAFYDNFPADEVLATRIDTTIRYTKRAEWIGDRFKEREIANALREETASYNIDIDEVIALARQQKEYH